MDNPKQKFKEMSDFDLMTLLENYRQQTELAKPILAMNPVPMPIQNWVQLRDANQELLHFMALIEMELESRGKL